MNFPESDTVWSSAWAQRSLGVPPQPTSCAVHVSNPARPLRAAASVSLYVRSESDVDEDSWITFSDVSSSGNEATYSSVYHDLPLPTTSCSLEVVSEYGSLIVHLQQRIPTLWQKGLIQAKLNELVYP
ncbi:hypothetical protein Tco_0024216 [Tanacetum coccineum]